MSCQSVGGGSESIKHTVSIPFRATVTKGALQYRVATVEMVVREETLHFCFHRQRVCFHLLNHGPSKTHGRFSLQVGGEDDSIERSVEVSNTFSVSRGLQLQSIWRIPTAAVG